MRTLGAGLVLVLLTLAAAFFVLPFLGYDLVRDDASEPIAVERAAQLITEVNALPPETVKPRNIVLFVADGMGFAHLAAARAAHHGVDGPAAWDRFPVSGWMRPHPSGGYVTDSAASATAFATGEPTYNGAIGVDADGSPLPTLFEKASALGYRTGSLTDSYFWDATPAAFAAHAASRRDAWEILDALAESPLDLLVGELQASPDDEDWAKVMEVLGRRFELLAAGEGTLSDPGSERPVAAIFEEGSIADPETPPELEALVDAALERFETRGEPFVLLVESEETDSASHNHDFPRLLRGLETVENSLTRLLDFADARGDTLLIFTADHETGALALDTGEQNASLRATWGSHGHTGSVVPLLAIGPGSELFAGSHANWQIGRRLAQLLADPADAEPPAADVSLKE